MSKIGVKRINAVLVTILFGVEVVCTPLYAQEYGKNKVQYRDFTWNFIQTPHFDIYFYADGEPLAIFAATISETAYEEISKMVGWRFQKRYSILVYSSHNDFQQTNVIYEYMPEGVGGVTELFKNRVVVPFEGSYEQFRHVIHHELVHAMINDMIYGGSLQNALSSRIQLNLPLWLNEGLAEYLSMKWDTQADMILRDIAVHDQIPNVRELDYYMAYKGGQSVWRFIAEKYGWEKIADLMRAIKNNQDVEKGFQRSIGMNYEELSDRWKNYLKKEYWPDVAGRVELEDFSQKLTDHKKLNNYFNIAPSISPDGSTLAVLTDRSGYSDIILISARDGKKIGSLVKGNRTPDFEELKWLQPGISWSPDGKKITFAAKSGEKDAIYILNVKTKKTEKYSFELDGIFETSWSPDGTQIAFVGNKGPASDIYILTLQSGEIKNLTHDIFSDSEPVWSPDGSRIAFLSNRGKMLRAPVDFSILTHDFSQNDIYVLRLESDELTQITDTPFNESSPVWANTKTALFYTSDAQGVWNLYSYDLDNGETKSLSNVLTGIFQLTLSKDDQKLYFAGYSKLGWNVYSVSHPLDLPMTDIHASNFIANQTNPMIQEEQSTDKDIDSEPQEKPTFGRYIFAPEYAHFNQEIDSTQGWKEVPVPEKGYLNSDGTYRVNAYKTLFSLDLANAQASFSNQFGYRGYTVFSFSDIMGDHRIFLGTEMIINLENSDYYVAYNYLKNRPDYLFALVHVANFLSNGYDFLRLRQRDLFSAVSYPINHFSRMEFGLTDQYLNSQWTSPNEFGEYVVKDEESLHLMSMSLGWVYDNSLWGFTAPSDGWRSMVQVVQSLNVFNDNLDFRTLMIDSRRYFKLSQNYDIAFRMMGGTSQGKQPQKFLLGGVENWLFGTGETKGKPDGSRFNDEELDIFDSDNPEFLRNLYFSNFVLPVRGSRFIEKVGSNVLLTNVELRFPFVNYLDLGFPLRMIFGNIRGIAFFDVGAAWDDQFNPTKRLSNGQKDFDDLIGGYGIGLRIYLGFAILRIDTAWDYRLHGTSKPQYYFSLGTDL